MPVVPEGAKQSTLNINSIHGGQAAGDADFTGLPSPCVPDSCRMVIDRRFLIEEDIDDVQAEVMEVLRKVEADRDTFRYDIRELHRVLPTMTQKDAPIVQTVARAISDTMGTDAQYVVSPGPFDQKHIDRIGKLSNCIAYGPGILDLAHKPDEYVGVDDMLDSAKVMGRTLIELLASPEEAA
jgi:succinyl-diaminopimelate desuccinylase